MSDKISFAETHLEILESTDNKSWIIVQGFHDTHEKKARDLFHKFCERNRKAGFRLVRYKMVRESGLFIEEILIHRPADTTKEKRAADYTSRRAKGPKAWHTIRPSSLPIRLLGEFLLSSLVAGPVVLFVSYLWQSLHFLQGLLEFRLFGLSGLFVILLSVCVRLLEAQYQSRNDTRKKGFLVSCGRFLFRMIAETKERNLDEDGPKQTKGVFEWVLSLIDRGRQTFGNTNSELRENFSAAKISGQDFLERVKEESSAKGGLETNSFEELQSTDLEKKIFLEQHREELTRILDRVAQGLLNRTMETDGATESKNLLFKAILGLMHGISLHIFDGRIPFETAHRFIAATIGGILAYAFSYEEAAPVSEMKKEDFPVKDFKPLFDQGKFIAARFRKEDPTLDLLLDETMVQIREWVQAQNTLQKKKGETRYVASLQPFGLTYNSEEWHVFRGIVTETLFYLYSEGILYKETDEGFIFIFYNPEIAVTFFYNIYETYRDSLVGDNLFFLRGTITSWPAAEPDILSIFRTSVAYYTYLGKDQFALSKTLLENLPPQAATEIGITLPKNRTEDWYIFSFVRSVQEEAL